ncbi:MAG TPA: toll/interleukin-1 receptor domain-containing protein [Thermoanaerobaculia bacterium]|nr:toll/interleukin-1 receptor domain-containing protein [Thermoanaerobaculia bacterium]
MRLFGDDIFISYAHADAGEYALALVARLSKRYAVYVDRVGSKAGEQISDKVLRHLKKASMLIVIVSDDATRETSKVREEVELFALTKRPILVIDAGALDRCSWKESFQGLSIAKESPEAFAKHRPSPGVRRSVEQTRKYWTRTNRLLAIAASIIIVTIGVVAVAWRQVDRASREVQRQQSAAAALRLANLATTAWQRGMTPVDDVLLMVAESLRRGATPSALQLASVARSLRPRFVSRFGIDFEDKMQLQDGRTLVLNKSESNVVEFIDLSTGGARLATPDCNKIFLDSMTPTAVAVKCSNHDIPRGLFIDLGTGAITPAAIPAGRGQTIAGLIAGGPLANAVVVSAVVFEFRDRTSGERIGEPVTVGNGSGTPPTIQLLTFSEDGRVLAVASTSNAGGDVWLFEVPTGRLCGHLILAGAAGEIALNHDGSALAVKSGTPNDDLGSGTIEMALSSGGQELTLAWRMMFHSGLDQSLHFVGDAVMFRDSDVVRIVAAGERGEAREVRRIVDGGRLNFATVFPDGDVMTVTDDHATRWKVGAIPAPGGYPAGIDSTGSRVVLWRDRTVIVRDLARGADVFRKYFPLESDDDDPADDSQPPVALDAGGHRLTVGFPKHTDTYDVLTGDNCRTCIPIRRAMHGTSFMPATARS